MKTAKKKKVVVLAKTCRGCGGRYNFLNKNATAI
jgi:hypothetical protein